NKLICFFSGYSYAGEKISYSQWRNLTASTNADELIFSQNIFPEVIEFIIRLFGENPFSA
ncbi:hypothetical protein, partial [Klebsiella aerogenes]|uniref:hypothetical protein n=1 Tax=Klebsiella aerogenes TaxID=548 RepID=UPI001952EC18